MQEIETESVSSLVVLLPLSSDNGLHTCREDMLDSQMMVSMMSRKVEVLNKDVKYNMLLNMVSPFTFS